MKIILSLLFCFYSSLSFSQIIQPQEQRQAILDVQKKEIYIGGIGLSKPYPIKNSFAMVIVHRDVRSNATNVFFDFGQESGYFDIDYIIDENGKKFEVYSAVDALNYMKELGWFYKESNSHFWIEVFITNYLFENTGEAVVPILKE